MGPTITKATNPKCVNRNHSSPLLPVRSFFFFYFQSRLIKYQGAVTVISQCDLRRVSKAGACRRFG